MNIMEWFNYYTHINIGSFSGFSLSASTLPKTSFMRAYENSLAAMGSDVPGITIQFLRLLPLTGMAAAISSSSTSARACSMLSLVLII
jgi:hypothetical protein